MNRFFRKILVVAWVTFFLSSGTIQADALSKLEAEKLEAVHNAIQELKPQLEQPVRSKPFSEFRANLHVHSKWSHDSRGQIEDIVAAAKSAGTQVLMFSEHPAAHYDFFADGHQGIHDGVLLIPGAEMKGFLVYPTFSMKGIEPEIPQEISDLVTGRDGQLFVSHLEERMDWDIQGVTGVEIYNTHADFKDEAGMISALKNPLRMIQLAGLLNKYPQECFSALQNYPKDYLKRWDELCMKAPHTGVSANDAHQNVGLLVRWVEGDQARIEDALGEARLDLSLAAVPNSAALCAGKQPGDVIYQILLDPYFNSLNHVGTHLLMQELSEPAVRDALKNGRAFVAFDWLADSTGFDFAAFSGDQRIEMGTQLKFEGEYRFEAMAPLPVHWRLIRNGELVTETHGRSLSHPADLPGIYRTEAWLDIAGEKMIWILSNPIYLQSSLP
jgi:hypothetical protein